MYYYNTDTMIKAIIWLKTKSNFISKYVLKIYMYYAMNQKLMYCSVSVKMNLKVFSVSYMLCNLLNKQ
jgi:hypothetical protein